MFVAGANPLWLGGFAFAALGGLILVATQISERMGRLSAFLHPQNYKEDAGLQQMQALIAWGSGGMEGLGLGNGRQKMLYLPYAHTDRSEERRVGKECRYRCGGCALKKENRMCGTR